MLQITLMAIKIKKRKIIVFLWGLIFGDTVDVLCTLKILNKIFISRGIDQFSWYSLQSFVKTNNNRFAHVLCNEFSFYSFSFSLYTSILITLLFLCRSLSLSLSIRTGKFSHMLSLSLYSSTSNHPFFYITSLSTSLFYLLWKIDWLDCRNSMTLITL